VGAQQQVAVTASDNVGVKSVQILLDGGALGPALTTAPYMYMWNTTTTKAGTHNLGATITDTSNNTAAAATVAITVPAPVTPPPTGSSLNVDAAVSTDATSGSAATPAFNTAAPGETLLAFGASDGPTWSRQSMAVSGGGLTWTRLAQANTQLGVSEIWKAVAPTALHQAIITSTARWAGFHQSLTLVAYAGTSGTGAAVTGGQPGGAPSLSLTTTKANSYVIGVGDDWDGAIARTVGAGQSMVHQWADQSTFDTYWVQASAAATPTAGSAVTLNDTAPTSDRWNFAAVEVYPGS